MTYISKPMGSRLGIWTDTIEKKRAEKRLDDKGFPLPRDRPADDEDIGPTPLEHD